MSATNELLSLCNDILGVVQLESGQNKEISECFHLEHLLSHTTTLLQPVAHDKNLALSYQLDPEIPVFLSGERLKIDRILLNLSSNALKFTKTGYVKIIVRKCRTRTNKITKHDHAHLPIEIIVEDSGMGIPKDKQEIIFECFSRLTRSHTGSYKGSGLGLYTVRQYVKQLGGSILVESDVDKGSRFIVTLPLQIGHKRECPSILKEETIDTDLSKVSALIVEDSEPAAIGLQQQLQNFDCKVDVAKDGRSALQLTQKNAYDIIFMDMGLPDIDEATVTNNSST